uniref:IPT/TIG domain-containing protein n=1 Tax=Solibacter usitatus (strain Ellin6076) TaxID=234267 RepID=Q01WR6_SOLUE
MRRQALLLSIFVIAAHARHDTAGCATTQQTSDEVLFLHRQSPRRFLPRAAAISTNRDIGNVAIIEDSGGVVEKLNQFNLDNTTLAFAPTTLAATAYSYSLSPLGYDATAASQGTPVLALGDDDSRQLALPFAFPFYGAAYRQVFVNSDGNLTFTAGDSASSGRSVGRMTGGPPRISPLFDDLDPSQPNGSVRVFTDSSHMVITWLNVREWAQSGIGAPVTFQVRLYVDGRIQFSYQGVNPSLAVVGIAPGTERNGSTLVSFQHDPSTDQSGAVLERFGNTQDIDVVSVAQKFYETHEDAYDYLVIYNNLGIDAASGAVAYESTVRSSGTGYSVPPSDHGADYGSPSRLRSVLNMGPITNYPLDPHQIVPLRSSAQDTPLTVLGHEAGHLFLAFASVPDPAAPTTLPMLGFGGAHWSFVFNSEASLDEGEQITDRGAGISPRFVTTAVTQGYSPLDRYLMGFGSAADVPPTFYVKGYDTRFTSPLNHPVRGASFDGVPVPVTAADIAQALGRRTPDYTVAQHHFRFAFILVVAAGSQDAALASSVQQVEAYRQQFPAAYADFSANIGMAETTLNKSVRLSLFPAGGVVAGGSGTATLTLATAPKTDLTINIATSKVFAQAPATVTIPAGLKTASFPVTGLKNGVEELTAVPADTSYEIAFARIQVAAASQLSLRTVSGDNQIAGAGPLPAPIVAALSDINGLVYAGARITAVASDGGAATPAVAVTDAAGQAAFQWTPGSAGVNTLTLAVEGAPAVTLRLNAGSATPAIGAVVNAASSLPGMAAGSIDTIYGVNLAGATVALNGTVAQQLYSGDTQINFFVPPSTALGTGTLTVTNAAGVTATAGVTVTAADPGIFAIVQTGDYLVIYGTGLGPTRASGDFIVTTVQPTVYLGSTPVAPAFSGLTPGFVGLYQVNVQLPPGLVRGAMPVTITSGQKYSNAYQFTVQ